MKLMFQLEETDKLIDKICNVLVITVEKKIKDMC